MLTMVNDSSSDENERRGWEVWRSDQGREGAGSVTNQNMPLYSYLVRSKFYAMFVPKFVVL